MQKETLAIPHNLKQTIQLTLFRHGQTLSNANNLVTGNQESPLSDLGKKQASAIGLKLHGTYDLAIVSTLMRTEQTLSLAFQNSTINNFHKIPLIKDGRLNERCLGVLEGRQTVFVKEFNDGDFDYAPEGGETYRSAALRTLSSISDLAELATYIGARRILLCGHNGILRLIRGIILEEENPKETLAFSFKNAEVVELNWSRLVFPKFLKD